MALQTIPEELLYRLLPEAVIDLDERGLLQALIGGQQDHAETLKSFAKKFELFYDPASLGDETQYNVILASFYGPTRNIVSRSVIIDDSTPSADDQEELDAWAIERLEIDSADFISASYGYDSDRAVTEDLLTLLADTIGAVVYATDEITTLEQRRRAVASYFPRLKFKGTTLSFDVLGRMIGFQHVAMIPLWQRASLRKPDDVGNSQNNPDFSADPQFIPSSDTGIIYDPNNVLDGPFYSWNSGPLSLNSEEPNFYESVNGFNPFMSINQTSAIVGHPDDGIYVFTGGAPHNKASVSPSGSGFTFESLYEGESFNGVKVLVTTVGTLRQVSVVERLSAIKYRSSHYDLGLFRTFPGLLDDGDFETIQPNKDLQEYPTLVINGTAEVPYYPWTAGSVQAEADNIQLDINRLGLLRTQAIPYFEELRAATRTPRRVVAGWSSEDDVIYAAYVAHQELFTATTGTLATYSGTATEFPADPYLTEIDFQRSWESIISRSGVAETYIRGQLAHPPVRGTVEVYDGSTLLATDNGAGILIDSGPHVVIDGNVDYVLGHIRVRVNSTLTQLTVRFKIYSPLSGESNLSQPEIVHFSGGSLTGDYHIDTGSFAFSATDAGPDADQVVIARWSPDDFETLRTEPAGTVKTEFRVGYQDRPEDDIPTIDTPGSLQQTADDVAWWRPIIAQGETVHPDIYDSLVPSVESLAYASDQIQITDHSGVEYKVVGIDDIKAVKDPTIRVLFDSVELQKTSTHYEYEPYGGDLVINRIYYNPDMTISATCSESLPNTVSVDVPAAAFSSDISIGDAKAKAIAYWEPLCAAQLNCDSMVQYEVSGTGSGIVQAFGTEQIGGVWWSDPWLVDDGFYETGYTG